MYLFIYWFNSRYMCDCSLISFTCSSEHFAKAQFVIIGLTFVKATGHSYRRLRLLSLSLPSLTPHLSLRLSLSFRPSVRPPLSLSLSLPLSFSPLSLSLSLSHYLPPSLTPPLFLPSPLSLCVSVAPPPSLSLFSPFFTCLVV